MACRRTGANLLGDGNHNVFLRLGSGQVGVWDVNAAGAIVTDPRLTIGGNPFAVDLGEAVVSVGADAATHQQDFILQLSGGQTQSYDVSINGVVRSR